MIREYIRRSRRSARISSGCCSQATLVAQVERQRQVRFERLPPLPGDTYSPALELQSVRCTVAFGELGSAWFAEPRGLGELDLTCNAGVLLGPQLGQRFGNPAVQRSESVQPRVTGSAEGDQGIRNIARVTVMDGELFTGPAYTATMVVAGQDFFPQAGETGAAAVPAPVTSPTEPAAKELETPAGAAERDLMGAGHGLPY